MKKLLENLMFGTAAIGVLNAFLAPPSVSVWTSVVILTVLGVLFFLRIREGLKVGQK